MLFFLRHMLRPLLLAGSLLPLRCLAQSTSSQSRIIPPPPETAQLFRYLDYSVNHATGVPEISVPLYTITSGSLSVPITLGYHAGGRRPTDETGAVGLGWSLQAGGQISRTIYGLPDEYYWFPSTPVPKMNGSFSNTSSYDYLTKLWSGTGIPTYDTEYDIFSYAFGNKSGKFVLSPHRDSVYLLQQAPLRFSLTNRFPSSVVDEKGNRYEFGQDDAAAILPNVGSYLTGKLLTRIISANQQDTISFSYTPVARRSAGMPIEESTIQDKDQTSHPQNAVSTPMPDGPYLGAPIRRVLPNF